MRTSVLLFALSIVIVSALEFGNVQTAIREIHRVKKTGFVLTSKGKQKSWLGRLKAVFDRKSKRPERTRSKKRH